MRRGLEKGKISVFFRGHKLKGSWALVKIAREHDPKVLRVVALSGGYSRAEATARLARNPGLIASFSRALSEGLHADQTDAEFHATLDTAIAEIYAASNT